MNRLELKHISSYLPYGLKWYHPKGKTGLVTTYNASTIIASVNNQGYKIVLRPMSDLIKELPDGTIPIMELAKIATGEEYKNYDIELTDYTVMCVDKDESAGFIIGLNSLDMTVTYEDVFNNPLENPIGLFDYLNQHHFDYRGLIEIGLAIDINTI